MRYPVASPDLSGNELEYVRRCFDSTWISSSGSFLPEFEARVAAFSHQAYGIATCNGTVALHLALSALGLEPGDEAIVPTLTFVATANAVTHCGAKPVFADCDADTWCMSPKSVERLIGPRTRGIVPVHLYGTPCNMPALTELARRHGLWILEDCAEALGTKCDEKPVGSLGDAGAFSFFGNKIATTGEGGMVVTGDDRLAKKLRLLRGQGMDPEKRYWHINVGYNYRMTNVAAAIGVAQMERIDELLAMRSRLAEWYHPRLQDIPTLTLSPASHTPGAVLWMCSVLLDDAAGREVIQARLAERGIETRILFYPIHHFPMYRDCRTDGGCPVATEISYRGLSLPTASYLQEADVEFITGELRNALRQFSRPVARAA
jgi:perosamine synthetase